MRTGAADAPVTLNCPRENTSGKCQGSLRGLRALALTPHDACPQLKPPQTAAPAVPLSSTLSMLAPFWSIAVTVTGATADDSAQVSSDCETWIFPSLSLSGKKTVA